MGDDSFGRAYAAAWEALVNVDQKAFRQRPQCTAPSRVVSAGPGGVNLRFGQTLLGLPPQLL